MILCIFFVFFLSFIFFCVDFLFSFLICFSITIMNACSCNNLLNTVNEPFRVNIKLSKIVAVSHA